MCILFDFSICKTPGKHVRSRRKARCLQMSKEIRYLSRQLKWTWQMYFWLKLKLWVLSCYHRWWRQMHSVCLTKRHPVVIWAWLWVPTIHYQACLRGGPCPSVVYTEADLWEWYRNDSFLSFLLTNILAVSKELWKENKGNQLSLILVCQNGSHLRLADLTCPPGHKYWSGSVLPSKSLGPLFPLELHNSKQKWPVCVQRHRRESRGLFSRASSSVLFCFVFSAFLYIV